MIRRSFMPPLVHCIVRTGAARCFLLPGATKLDVIPIALPTLLSGLAENPAAFNATQCVMSSTSNIYENLAIEESLLRSARLTPFTRDVGSMTSPPLIDWVPLQLLVFSYINDPCVVIGRNQCVFTEANVLMCRDRGAHVARRSSGGGTVFHDPGNVNFTFVTHRQSYQPSRTIGILMRFIAEHFAIDPCRLTTTQRHDIFLDGLKVSGSAMRLQRDTAFHHCTLLVSSDRNALRGALHPSGTFGDLATKATSSVRSPVTTLCEHLRLPAAADSAISIQEAFLSYTLTNGLSSYHCSELLADKVNSANLPVDGASHRNMTWECGVKSSNVVPTADETTACLHRLAPTSGHSLGSVAFVDPPGVKIPLRSHTHLSQEIDNLRSPSWIYGAMPAMSATVTVPLADVIACFLAAWGATPKPHQSLHMDASIVEHLLVSTADTEYTTGVVTCFTCRYTLHQGKVGAMNWSAAGQEGEVIDLWFGSTMSDMVKGAAICTDVAITDSTASQPLPNTIPWSDICLKLQCFDADTCELVVRTTLRALAQVWCNQAGVW